MSACSNTYRVSAISFCGVSVSDPIGGSIEESVEWISNFPGTRLSSANAIDKYSCKATAKWQGMSTPVIRGTQADTVYTLLAFDGTTAPTVTVSGTRAGSAGFDFDSKPHSQKQEAVFDAANTENLAPISVSA